MNFFGIPGALSDNAVLWEWVISAWLRVEISFGVVYLQDNATSTQTRWKMGDFGVGGLWGGIMTLDSKRILDDATCTLRWQMMY